MGTRCLTFVYDDNTPLLCMYRQMDGYPSGHGIELAEFLKDMKIVNGLPFGQEKMKIANGAGCLAAQIVAHFKEAPGGFYLQSPSIEDMDYIDYVYNIYVDSAELKFRLEIQTNNENILQPTSSVEDFLKFCMIENE